MKPGGPATPPYSRSTQAPQENEPGFRWATPLRRFCPTLHVSRLRRVGIVLMMPTIFNRWATPLLRFCPPYGIPRLRRVGIVFVMPTVCASVGNATLPRGNKKRPGERRALIVLLMLFSFASYPSAFSASSAVRPFSLLTQLFLCLCASVVLFGSRKRGAGSRERQEKPEFFLSAPCSLLPLYPFIAAWAAANRAMGTRKGEQET